MARVLKDRKGTTLLLIVIVGIVIGSYLSLLVGLLPGEHNVVRQAFTFNFLPINIGYPEPWLLDIGAIKFHIGVQIKLNFMSIVGLSTSLYLFKSYR